MWYFNTSAVAMKMVAFANHTGEDIATQNNQHHADGHFQNMGKVCGNNRFHHQGGSAKNAQR